MNEEIREKLSEILLVIAPVMLCGMGLLSLGVMVFLMGALQIGELPPGELFDRTVGGGIAVGLMSAVVLKLTWMILEIVRE